MQHGSYSDFDDLRSLTEKEGEKNDDDHTANKKILVLSEEPK